MSTVNQFPVRIKSVLLFLAGFCGVILIGFLVLRLIPQSKDRLGWQTIRPPQDVMALAFFQNKVWSGGSNGLFAIDVQSGQVFDNFIPEKKFKGITALLVTDIDQSLWVAHNQGISRLNGNQWETFTRLDGLPENQVLCLVQDHEGSIWAGTLHGAARLKEGVWQTFTTKDGLANDAVSLIFEDSKQNIWFGNGFTPVGGLTVWDGEHWTILSSSGNLPHASVNAIWEDADGTIWLGTGFGSLGGLAKKDGANWSIITQNDGLAGAKVRSLFRDRAGNLWVGSEYDGITVIGNGGYQIFTPRNGTAGWEVKTMLQAQDNSLWLGTENGLTRINSEVWTKEFAGK